MKTCSWMKLPGSRVLMIAGMAISFMVVNLGRAQPAASVLDATALRRYVTEFNGGDRELYQQAIPNAAAAHWLEGNVPRFECPDKDIELTYYFRWWTYRKHLRQTPEGFVITEFLPNVPWAGKFNTISCAAGHHFYEGRWIADPQYLDDYAKFWFRKGSEPRRYSCWLADALWARHLVHPDLKLLSELLPDLATNFEGWVKERRDSNGLFWQVDGEDGMEVSIGGNGYRVTINSYMYGDALAIARIADVLGQSGLSQRFRDEAAGIARLTLKLLWDDQAAFFKVLPRGPNQTLATVRELHGFTPWYFNMPETRFAAAWKQLMDPQGFYAPFGPTTAEQRDSGFRVAYSGHECQWNGPSWPYSTSVTLVGLANLLNGPPQSAIAREDYVSLLHHYASSQRRRNDHGEVVPWIDENSNPFTGDWIARTLLLQRGQIIPERGKDYNHSTFCDLVVSGLVGLRPRNDDTLEINPLAPASWDYFCLDRVPYHGRWLTVLWDRTGLRYGFGKGLSVLVDGQRAFSSAKLERILFDLKANAHPESAPDGSKEKK